MSDAAARTTLCTCMYKQHEYPRTHACTRTYMRMHPVRGIKEASRTRRVCASPGPGLLRFSAAEE